MKSTYTVWITFTWWCSVPSLSFLFCHPDPPSWSPTMLTSHAPGSLSCYVLSLSSSTVTSVYLSKSQEVSSSLMRSCTLEIRQTVKSCLFLPTLDDKYVKCCFKTLCSTNQEVKLCFVNTSHLYFFIWTYLISRHASSYVSPCVTSCVKGDPSPQVEVYYWPNPMGLLILTNQLQMPALRWMLWLVLTGTVGLMPASCPIDPKKQV